jgi:hypothetical protein
MYGGYCWWRLLSPIGKTKIEHGVYNTYYMSQGVIWREVGDHIFTSRRRVKI